MLQNNMMKLFILYMRVLDRINRYFRVLKGLKIL